MKKAAKAKDSRAHALAPRDSDLMVLFRELSEQHPLACAIQKSYVISRFWAWFSQIQINPEMRIPIPRFLSVREPQRKSG